MVDCENRVLKVLRVFFKLIMRAKLKNNVRAAEACGSSFPLRSLTSAQRLRVSLVTLSTFKIASSRQGTRAARFEMFSAWTVGMDFRVSYIKIKDHKVSNYRLPTGVFRMTSPKQLTQKIRSLFLHGVAEHKGVSRERL